MHEYPITEEIVRIAQKHCEEASAQRVKAINLVLGEYSGLVGESIHMYFDIIAQDTPCEDAQVNIKRIKAKIRCPHCDLTYERKPFSFACPQCGADGEPTEIGKEFYIESIEVEE